ncbi:myb-like protein X [Bombyx mori]|uniref:Cuticle protein n=1 Tax=Bombyx mori TaxID=7091 RepID=A0A8R2C6K5_BOMMO|nr:myb-like protein X [Bombyx mori]
MLSLYVTTCFLILTTQGLSIGTVSVNVTEPQQRASELFPDWVPFKNKHGEELGEFVQVVKPKPKKRLALPVNFILKAVAEPEGDDYYDKGQGEGDGDDAYDKKEWSDENRPAPSASANKQIVGINHTDLSGIAGLVNIITQKPAIAIAEAIRNSKIFDTTPASVLKASTEKVEQSTEEVHESNPSSSEDTSREKQKPEETEEENDDEESSTEKQKPEVTDEERTEQERKKAKILSSVDELKERHAQEQRVISEKVKEEELIKEERERDSGQSLSESDENDKYSVQKNFRNLEPDYEEYDNSESVGDKYKINSPKRTTKTPKSNNNRVKGMKNVEVGKLSVFKSPQLFAVYDDDSDESVTSARPPATRTRGGKYSSKYKANSTSAPDSDESVRISLIPEENNSKGEPTLFFPKKRKNRRRRIKTTTPATDSFVAETVADNTAKHLSTIPDAATADTLTTAGDMVSSPDTVSTTADAASDAVPAPSDHKKEEKKNEDFENEKGGDREYHSEHEEEHEEHGRKAYEGVHKDTRVAKGHIDKENHLGKYNDQGGVDKHHHDETGHYGAHHHEEHGKKQAKYEESGKHSKGHSTKGSHDIHKKEEYEKKVEFFEEEGDSDEEEKHGGYHNEREHKGGGHFKKGDAAAGHQHHSMGKGGHFGKGGHEHAHKGHKSAAGHDHHGKHGNDHFQKGGKEGSKKWVYHHGHPAKTANLVLVDKRADRYFHGPQYYG